jgi:hypothetical protein
MGQFRIRRLEIVVVAAAIAFGGTQCIAQSSFLVESPLALAAHERIERALDEPASIDVVEQPLKDVMAHLQKSYEIAIQLDEKAIIDAGGGADTPLTANLSNVRLRSALDLLLQPRELNWIIEHDVLLITSDSRAKEHIETRVYPVRDLVEVRDEHGAGEDYDSLIDVITSTISPTTWTDAGGTGSISPFPNAGVLILSQTERVHEEVDSLLATLRLAKVRQGVEGEHGKSDRAADDEIHETSEALEPPEREPSRRMLARPVPQPAWRMPQVYR